jgi:hypothetical protein
MQGLDSRYLNTAFYKSQSMGGKRRFANMANLYINFIQMSTCQNSAFIAVLNWRYTLFHSCTLIIPFSLHVVADFVTAERVGMT